MLEFAVGGEDTASGAPEVALLQGAIAAVAEDRPAARVGRVGQRGHGAQSSAVARGELSVGGLVLHRMIRLFCVDYEQFRKSLAVWEAL